MRGRRRVLKIYDSFESPNEGACPRYLMNRNRHRVSVIATWFLWVLHLLVFVPKHVQDIYMCMYIYIYIYIYIYLFIYLFISIY